MVDFQSRNTRRGVDEDEGGADESGPETVTYAVATVVADRALEDDQTGDGIVDAVEDLLDKHLPGFGELFRVLSHDHEGTAIVGTRATTEAGGEAESS